ncbi:Fic family protein [Bifidobacterium sp. MA2]|uniref:protein adenylyltransferase n=1 Tax=Bifidobacterium santillanense TaxID=2809028 RepID=A0ABS5UMK4_9BIFI|nr:Fic family protein [Bifidobacterium santillanense]MBT1172146.1 Fic family protein [Bifidobacterium santillanense]
MTPAERASAVAFALKNCALEAMTPGDATMRAAADYEAGHIDVARLIDVADGEGAPASGVFARTVLLAERGWRPTGDLAELTAIHRGLFEGVFDDAGLLRTSDTTRKATHDESRASNPEAFFPAALIETGASNIASELAEKRNLQVLDRPAFVREFAHVYDELGYLHPFRGGNAMTLRVFGSRLAHDAGWDLDWGTVTREAYRQAKHAAYLADTSVFERLFAGIVRPANPTRVFLIAGFEQGPAH